MGAHLLSLSALHAAAPGVLDIVFGADGDFEGAPEWRCPIWYTYGSPRWYVMRGGDWCVRLDGRGHWVGFTDRIGHIKSCYLDLRLPSIAARLAGLCNRAMRLGEMEIDESTADVFSRAMRGTAHGWCWREGHAAFLASLTLTLAPRIAALGGARD